MVIQNKLWFAWRSKGWLQVFYFDRINILFRKFELRVDPRSNYTFAQSDHEPHKQLKLVWILSELATQTELLIMIHLTLSQRTNFRLVQIERVCR